MTRSPASHTPFNANKTFSFEASEQNQVNVQTTSTQELKLTLSLFHFSVNVSKNIPKTVVTHSNMTLEPYSSRGDRNGDSSKLFNNQHLFPNRSCALTNGILTPQSSPPSLQLICSATFITTLLAFLGSNVLPIIT